MMGRGSQSRGNRGYWLPSSGREGKGLPLEDWLDA